jgi:iron-sulfur cluster repair protein YtfE (RIC family)
VTSSDHPGLRLRLAREGRRIAGQHEYLGALQATTRAALERGDPAEISNALRGFEGALGAHFDLEEHLHFPALHGHRPDLESRIEELVREHRVFRETLAGLRRQAESPDRPQLLSDFQSLTAALQRHEALEEDLFPR